MMKVQIHSAVAESARFAQSYLSIAFAGKIAKVVLDGASAEGVVKSVSLSEDLSTLRVLVGDRRFDIPLDESTDAKLGSDLAVVETGRALLVIHLLD